MSSVKPALNVHPETLVWGVLGVLVGAVGAYASTLQTRFALTLIASLLFALLCLGARHFLKDLIFGAFVFTLPIQLGKSFFNQPYAGGEYGLRINIPEVILVAMLGIALVEALRSGVRRRRQDVAIIATVLTFLGLLGLSTLTAEYRDLAVFELIRTVVAILVFTVVVMYATDSRRLRLAVFVTFVATAVQVGIGLIQSTTGAELGLRLFGEMELQREMLVGSRSIRVGGAIGHPNAYATYLVLTLPLTIVVSRATRFPIVRWIAYAVFGSADLKHNIRTTFKMVRRYTTFTGIHPGIRFFCTIR